MVDDLDKPGHIDQIYPGWVEYQEMHSETKTRCGGRLKRIEGQVRGIAKMIEDDRYCIDILTQVQAVRAALRKVEGEVLKDHVATCVEHAIESGDAADQRRKIQELMTVLDRSDN